jgi:predicted nucleic acid-binding protein
MSRVFLDTNVLAYAFDSRNAPKRDRARALLKHLYEEDEVCVSTQVLQEFYVVATKKLGLDPLVAKEALRSFERFSVVAVDPRLIAEAIDVSILHKLSFWDSLIVAAAEIMRCDTLYTEDLADGAALRGVAIRNPFKAGR